MTALRWFLGITLSLLLGGYLFLFMVSNSFRRSFGASANNPLLAILPIAFGLLLLAGIIWPANRILMHIAAGAAVGWLGFCIYEMIKEGAPSILLGILYGILWLVFYWLATWRGTTA